MKRAPMKSVTGPPEEPLPTVQELLGEEENEEVDAAAREEQLLRTPLPFYIHKAVMADDSAVPGPRRGEPR